jgi:hypothetical protein
MSGTSEIVAACCCPISPCPCATTLTSIVVNWSGSITLTPMACLDYWQTFITQTATQGFSDCKWQCNTASVNTVVYTMPSTVVSLSYGGSGCGGTTCYSRTESFKRWVIPFIPFGGYATAAEYCQNEVQDVLYFSTYRKVIGYGVTVYMPNPSNPKWRININAGSVTLRFISTDGNYSCTPTSFVLDASFPLPVQNQPCYGHCNNPDPCNSCTYLDYPPIVSNCSYFGPDTRHRVTFDAGSISIA